LLLCSKHQQQIAGYVGRRFGRKRYGGRYASSVEDFVQECYEKLLRPNGLGTFRPDAGSDRADAFGAWLGGLLYFYCNNKLKYLRLREPESWHPIPEPAPNPIPGPAHTLTPHEVFMQECIRDLVCAAAARVEVNWKVRGAQASRRFDVFLPFVIEGKTDYKQAQEVLGGSEEHARKIKCDLAKDIKIALRRLVRDTLDLEPGLDHDGIERRIDEEIDALFKAAFPPGTEPPCEQESDDQQPESRP
jgi:hypothetical protein